MTEKVGTDGIMAGHLHYVCAKGHRMSAPASTPLSECAACVHGRPCRRPLTRTKP